MKLKLVRKYFTANSTVSELWVDNSLFCHVLEDVDRALDAEKMSKDRIGWLKQFGKTAIPYGEYEIINSFSNRFKTYLPLLVNVPGYEGIRIHAGNYHTDTEGCLLPGTYNPNTPDFVGNSKKTFADLFKLLSSVEKTEKIYITISL